MRVPALLSGPYHIGAVLGTGGSSTVYVGFDLGKDSRIPVAIKRLSPAYAGDLRHLAMLAREAHILASVEHPNIAQMIDFGTQNGEVLLVMEYVDGTSCGRLMNLLDDRGSRFPLRVTLGIADAVLAALAHVHDAKDADGNHLGLTHGDVAPGNVLLGRLGECKLGDFGIARCSGDPLLEPSTIAGKLGYMSPEQARGEPTDHRSDLFSFAVMLAEMLLMCRFFPETSPEEQMRAAQRADLATLGLARDRLALELRLILATALAQDPAERFQSAADLRDALRAYAKHEGVVAAGPRQIGAWLAELDLWPAKSGLRVRVDPADCDLDLLKEITARRQR